MTDKLTEDQTKLMLLMDDFITNYMPSGDRWMIPKYAMPLSKMIILPIFLDQMTKDQGLRVWKAITSEYRKTRK